MEKDQSFKKVLNRFDILVLAFGAMIGWGWVVLSGSWIKSAGSMGALIAFAIGGILVLFVGLTFAELASAIPKAGGELHFSLRALGRSASFFTSWALVLGYFSVVSFEAVAFPTVFEYLFPTFKFGYLYTIAGWDVYLSWVLIGVVGAIFITAFNYFGVKTATVFQVILTVLIAVVGLMLAFGSTIGGDFNNLKPLFHDGSSGILAVLIMTPFMFVGFGVVPQVAEEANIPFRSIGKMMVIAVVAAIVFYLVVIFGVGAAMNATQLDKTELASADSMAIVYGSALFAKILIIGGVAGILTSWNGFIMGASRVLFAMTTQRMMPHWFGKLHPKYKTPYQSILVIGILSMFSPLLGRPALVWLVDAGGLSVVIAWFMVSLSFIVLRRKEPELARPYRAGKSAIVGYIAVILAFGVGILYMPTMPASLIWPYEWIIFIAWWVIGAIFYVKMKKEDRLTYAPPKTADQPTS